MLKKMKCLILTMFMVIGGMSSVSAEEIETPKADLSQVKLTVIEKGIGNNNYDLSDSYVKITDGVFVEENDYQVLLTTSTQNIPESGGFSEIGGSLLYSITTEDGKVIKNSAIQSGDYLKIAEKYTTVYATFYESLKGENVYKKISNPILIKRPADLPLSKRVKVYAWGSDTNFFNYTLNHVSTERKVNYRVGLVNDKNILTKIKNGDPTGLEKLLAYAKDNQNSISNGQAQLGANQPALFKQTDLTKDAYYYIYVEVDGENGSYVPVEDVQLYQALQDYNGEYGLLPADHAEFKWNLEETEWDKFVENVSKNSVLKNDKLLVTITHTSDKMTINTVYNNQNYVTEFNYVNGIISYQEDKNKDAEALCIDSIFQNVVIQEIISKFNYKLPELKAENTFTISANGIEYMMKTLKVDESFIIDKLPVDKYFSTLKLDLINGLDLKQKNEVDQGNDNIEDTVENPPTGVYISLITILVGSVIGIFFMMTKKKNKFMKI